MYRIACPSCGAEVAFRSAASVMAVCEYCQSTLVRDADSVRDIGKMSAVLEDYSPLQIGTSGLYEGQHFTLVGRIQLRYDAGTWNEWYALFDDGSAGWLSDASGQFAFTRDDGPARTAPAFEQLKVGMSIQRGGRTFVATDVRPARCVGGQGELPFKVGDGWQARVADFRSGPHFLTIDYSHGEPLAYRGKAVELDALQCQLLRSIEAIESSAGKLKGSVNVLGCPQCGAQMKYRSGVSDHLVCASCHSDIAIEGETAVVLKKHHGLAEFTPTLKLGSRGTIDRVKWDVIGFLRRRLVIGTSEWTEYLLFNPKRGFLWLSESEDGWEKISVLNALPEPRGTMAYLYQGAVYNRTDVYGSVVTYAAGAFNWRVSVGDHTHISAYRNKTQMLYAELTNRETTWSHAQTVTDGMVRRWFGLPRLPAKAKPARANRREDDSTRQTAVALTTIAVAFNVPALLGAIAYGNLGDVIFISLVGLFALWLPILNED